ncbi:methyl-accepting chemotaxis protein [Azotosporobacter soli]|uniref:methyl-accepting chemotaxis protein n=1 Tax=Azotosporobacter soli TaxID=3055040 RepID=UPI0031FE94CB
MEKKIAIGGIRGKLLSVMLSLLVLSLGVSALLSYYFANQYLKKSIDDTAMAVASDYSQRIQGDIDNLRIQLEELANSPTIEMGKEPAAIRSLLADLQKRQSRFDNVNFIQPDGNGFRNDGSVTNVSDRDYYKKVVETKKPYVSDPLLSRSTGKLAVIIGVPVLNSQNQLIGMISGNLSLDRASEMLKDLKFKETGYGFLVDDGGLVIAHPKRAELIGKLDLSKKEIDPVVKAATKEMDERLMKNFAAAKSGKAVLGEYAATDGVNRLGIFAPFQVSEGQQWIMVVSAPMEEATREVNNLTKIMLGVAIGAVLLASLVIWIVSGKLAMPISRMRDEAMLLAEGNLRRRDILIDSNDEIGQLSRAFDVMTRNLRELITKVQSQSDTVAASSEELTANAQQSADAASQVADSITTIAGGIDSQATAVTNMSAVVEEMSGSIEQIAATGKLISDIAAQAAQNTSQGGRVISQALEQMKEIGNGSQAVEHAIGELAKGSQEISEIVNLISSIAGQTNLLALNAAIEAARAGEQGRGFAVVAEEVRKLAEDSNQAAQRIAGLIQKNETDMAEAIQATQSSSKGVVAGVTMVGEAGETFKTIAGAVETLSIQIKEVSDAIDQIAVGSQDLVGSVQHIDSISKTNADEAHTVSAATEEQSASMDEVASASLALATTAGELQSAVAKFEV